jgi:uncharacterized protein YjbI with pentapeptide repeats
MNWTETREALHKAGVEDLPEEWQWRIDLRGTNLRGADLRDAYLGGAYLRDAYLSDADLSGTNLSGADLSDADLSGADLSDADLTGADLRDANLRGVYLSDADLTGTNLRGVYLYGAYLRGADLSGAYLNWNSRDLIAELLRQAAGDNWQRRALAGLILVSRDWCWRDFLALEHPEQTWALDVLRQYVKDGDGAPDFLQEKDDGDELA